MFFQASWRSLYFKQVSKQIWIEVIWYIFCQFIRSSVWSYQCRKLVIGCKILIGLTYVSMHQFVHECPVLYMERNLEPPSLRTTQMKHMVCDCSNSWNNWEVAENRVSYGLCWDFPPLRGTQVIRAYVVISVIMRNRCINDSTVFVWWHWLNTIPHYQLYFKPCFPAISAEMWTDARWHIRWITRLLNAANLFFWFMTRSACNMVQNFDECDATISSMPVVKDDNISQALKCYRSWKHIWSAHSQIHGADRESWKEH